jgi:hypothetical protein
MKRFETNYTNPTESKMLIDSGLPIDTADCAVHTASYDNSITVMHGGYTYTKWINEVYGCQEVAPYLPSWSVGRLIEILKICLTDKEALFITFELIKDSIFITRNLCQVFKEYNDVIDFSKLND